MPGMRRAHYEMLPIKGQMVSDVQDMIYLAEDGSF